MSIKCLNTLSPTAIRKLVKAATEKYMENFTALAKDKHCLDNHKSQYDITK